MSQQLQRTKWEIQQKQQLIYSLKRDIVRNELQNAELVYKIGIIQDAIQKLVDSKDGGQSE